MEQKKGQCIDCKSSNEQPLIAGRCQKHYWKYRSSLKAPKISPKKTQNKIKQVSVKRSQENRLYTAKRALYLAENIKCECCKVMPSTEIHHKKGRIGNLLTDTRYFLAVCRQCHTKIELNPEWAKENNYSLSRLSNHE